MVQDWIVTCPDGMICNPGGTKTNPCTSLTWSQIPRCPQGQQGFSTTTTVATTVVPSTFCANQAAVGNYVNPSDTTCKTYLRCNYYNGAYVGQKYTCPGTTLFSATTKTCVSGYTCV